MPRRPIAPQVAPPQVSDALQNRANSILHNRVRELEQRVNLHTGGSLLGPPTVVTGNGSYAVPDGCSILVIVAQGGGGSGGTTSRSVGSLGAAAGGGCGGQTVRFTVSPPPTDVPYSCGVGGVSNLFGSSIGTAGGDTTVKIGTTVMTARGGPAGDSVFSGGNSGAGGLPVTTPVASDRAITVSSVTMLGGLPGLITSGTVIGGAGGGSPYGTAGYNAAGDSSPAFLKINPAVGYGAGGAGSAAGTGSISVLAAGGNGSPGCVEFWPYG